MPTVAFVLPFGEPEEAYFADTLLTLLAADARRAGHRANVVRVYYHGRDPTEDERIRARLRSHLDRLEPELVVVERLFDAEPVLAGGRRVLWVTRGDSVEPVAGVRHVLGMLTELAPGRAAPLSPGVPSLRGAFRLVLGALERGDDIGGVPGVATLEDGALVRGEPLPLTGDEAPFDPVLDADVIAPGDPPAIRHKTLLGNAGCPFAADPLASPHYAGVELPSALPIARFGCAFCHMGGDYEKAPDREVVASLIRQAEYFARALPEIRAFTLSDQYAMRYLTALVEGAAARGLVGIRWLFPARPDAFVRERARLVDAARAASEVGHVIEVYLAGFEAFCDRELERYAKGTTKAELLEAVRQMRALRAECPEGFELAAARAHSLILWNPWTSPADVRESVETIREHDLLELFHEIGRNRLRLYRELPITWAAARDGALVERWLPGDVGSARRKGYAHELPWRFLDERTRVAHEVAARLRDRLGRETELDQLDVALDFAESGGTGWEACEPGLSRLEACLARLLGPDRPRDLRGAQTRALACLLTPSTLGREVEAVRGKCAELGLVPLVGGRDVSNHPLFPVAVRGGGAVIEAEHARRALDCGARHLSLRLPTPAALPSGLARSGVPLEARVRPLGGRLDELPEWAAWAAREGVPQLRLEIGLPQLGLTRLGAAADAIEALARDCRARGVGLETAPLAAGLGDFRFAPARHGRGP